jgi:DNA invertase Pin-like site-specific DNA recombinase
MPPRAYSYLRFSTPEQAKGDSRRRQAALAEGYAQRHGLELDTELTFQDLGVSAFRGNNAETGRLADFREAVRSGLVPSGSFLLVESLDRISRQAARRAFRVLDEIVEAGVVLVTLNDERQYSADSLDRDPTALMIALLTLIRANEESETKSRRVAAAWAAKREKATEKPMTSRCPGWLRLDKLTGRFEVIPERSDVVSRIFTEALAGVGQNSIARRLNEQGVPVFGAGGRQGSQWHRSYVVKILSNPATVGTMTPHRLLHDGTKKTRKALDPVPNYYPAIVPAETFNRVQQMRDGTHAPRRGVHAKRPVANIFGGLLRCPTCEGAMTRATKGDRWAYLVCTRAKGGAGCAYRAIPYPAVEGTVIAHIDEIIAECPTPRSEGLDERLEEIDVVLDSIEDDLERLADAVTRGGTVETLVERMRSLEGQHAELKAERRTLQDRRAVAMGFGFTERLEELREAARTRPLDRTRLNAALRVLLARVTPDRGTGMIEFEWKHGGESRILYGWPEDFD